MENCVYGYLYIVWFLLGYRELYSYDRIICNENF